MKHLLFILAFLAASAAFCAGEDDPWTAWQYRLSLRVVTPELSDYSGMATLRVNLGTEAAKDLADVRIIDEKGREQPWHLRSITASREASLVFRTVKGMRNYTLLFGNASARKVDYGVAFPIGRELIDDRLPARCHTHGLWEWVTTPVVSGVFAHTSPLKDHPGFHGASDLGEVPIADNTVLQQYVRIDKLNPPEQILVRVGFAGKPNEGDWEPKQHLNFSWGKGNIRGVSGTLRRMGDVPPAGEWVRLDIPVGELARTLTVRSREGASAGFLYGIDFCTDKGRAWWDCTSLGDIPGEAEPVALERSSGAKAAFVFQRLGAFKPAGVDALLQEVRFFPSAFAKATADKSASDQTLCAWDFGDGTKSDQTVVSHVFEGTASRRVSLTLTGPDGKPQTAGDDVEGARAGTAAQEIALELVSRPFLARSDEKALFNLRLDGALTKSRDFELAALLLDANLKEIRRESTTVRMLPGDKHPTFHAFSLDLGAPGVARVRFELLFNGLSVASRTVTVLSSLWPLDKLKMAGDCFVDSSDTPVVVRVESAPGEAARKPVDFSGATVNLLVVGDLPVAPPGFGPRLKDAVDATGAKGEVVVKRAGVETQPAWSMPYRLLAACASENVNPATQAVVVASASEMVLNGVPARTGIDAIAACVDQLRRRSNAEVVVLLPVSYAGFEDLARQYAIGLKLLGIEKDIPIVDVYSRSLSLGEENPELLKTARVFGGVLVQQLQLRVADMIAAAIVSDLLHPTPGVRGN